MESLRNEKNLKDLGVSQVSICGFDEGLSAKDLIKFLEYKVGIIWRCRLKKSWTPPESLPDFKITNTFDISHLPINNDYQKVKPHAFVHFEGLDAASKALNAAKRLELIHDGHVLMVNTKNESHSRVKRRLSVSPFTFSNVGVEIGTLVSRDVFFIGWKGPDYGVNLKIDPFDGRLKILFSKDIAFSFKDMLEIAVIKCDFKVEFLVRDINSIWFCTEDTSYVMVLQIAHSPWISYRTADDNIHDVSVFDLLDDEDPWIRTTDFTPNGAVGRCNTYRVSVSPRFGAKLDKALAYLKGCRIKVFYPDRTASVQSEPVSVSFRKNPFFSIEKVEGISFEVLYMVNAVVTKGNFNEHQLTDEFFVSLRQQSDAVNIASLLHIWAYRKPVYDASRRLKIVQSWLIKNPNHIKRRVLTDDNVEIRRLVITPTKAICLPPEVELSNRVLRKYREFSNSFLRVTFMDEGMQFLNVNSMQFYVAPIVRDLTKNSFLQRTTVFRRVKDVVTDGFSLCGRKYSFLAFSSNQLRDRSAWFFAEDGGTNVISIKRWMGNFPNKNVAKCSARIGQCFSSTHPTVNVPAKEVNFRLQDIERNGYNFSDGIGKISPDLAMEVAEKLQLPKENLPSAYQIRFAGCKGVVAIWPGNGNGIRLSLRPSMNKFESDHLVLEIVSWTRFQPGFLNRQIITLLSALDIPDQIFDQMQDSMISKLNQMLVDVDVAFDVLRSSCAEQGNAASLMLSAGFKPQMEPHLRGMLSCIRSAQLGDLLDKTRIFVPKGRWLMGCLDELAVLENGQCFIQASSPSLENCFARHGSRFHRIKNDKVIVLGAVAIAKNPCLHPGDVRILEAVDVPALHHLVDCLVFPQKGVRPHSNEASGSDLDGDLYFVTWDEGLIPPSKKSWPPMDYSPGEAKLLQRPVTHQDIVDFYTKNLLNESLGVICNAHVVHADISRQGALDPKCIELAQLAAIAVDSPKTGKFATMPPSLKPKVYPDFMGKEPWLSYKSEKILGKLFRKIKDATSDKEDGLPPPELYCSSEDLSFDTDLDVAGASAYLSDAWKTKLAYDNQLNGLLAHFQVASEGEVATGHVWSLPKYNSRKLGDVKERLKNVYSALQREFRDAFEDMGSEFEELNANEDMKNELYERKASAWYRVTYDPQWVRKSVEARDPEGEVVPARLSFAWIAVDYLVRIKVRRMESNKKMAGDGGKPIDHLAKYLRERMNIS